jgi:hypothetical protein
MNKFVIKEKDRFLCTKGLGCRLVDRIEEGSVFNLEDALNLTNTWKNVSIHEVTTNNWTGYATGELNP